MVKRILLVSLILLVIIPGLVAQEKIVVVFGDGGYPPFYSAGNSEDAKLSGLFIDFLKEFEKKHPEYQFTFASLPRMRMDGWMDTGRAQIFSLNNPMFNSPERKDNFLYSSPIWKTGDYLIMKKGKTVKFSGLDDLLNIKLGIIHGNSYNYPGYPLDDLIKEGKIKPEATKDLRRLLRMLKLGRVEAIIGNRHGFPQSCKDEGFNPSDFVFSENGLFEFELMMQINKERTDIVEKMNAFIAEIKKNGVLARLEAKYLK
ncbi:MAG: transporter substrate-binding domain-containing protein [Spirochaetes bacterium]|nr:transporter substrate-binding domain-containing protein [Spirochaetota bacterium]